MRKRCNAVTPLRIALVLLLAVACVGCADRAEMRQVAQMTITDVDLTDIYDGDYVGQFTCCHFTYSVMTTMRRERIASVAMLANNNSKAARKAAQIVLPRIVEAQSPNVDPVTGAATSSKAIMKAVENSLNNAPRR